MTASYRNISTNTLKFEINIYVYISNFGYSNLKPTLLVYQSDKICTRLESKLTKIERSVLGTPRPRNSHLIVHVYVCICVPKCAIVLFYIIHNFLLDYNWRLSKKFYKLLRHADNVLDKWLKIDLTAINVTNISIKINCL